MNGRIRKLMIESDCIGLNISNKMERFAQLIIQDCMDVVDGYTKPRTFETHYDAVEQIENLFGVKHESTD